MEKTSGQVQKYILNLLVTENVYYIKNFNFKRF